MTEEEIRERIENIINYSIENEILRIELKGLIYHLAQLISLRKKENDN